ncbi:heterokaryon incompatibility protein-domain-containing protein [Ustulina deusta]|nr:heterokaryon incompatibility protein-domain-containing protein [Ustulina deusta]
MDELPWRRYVRLPASYLMQVSIIQPVVASSPQRNAPNISARELTLRSSLASLPSHSYYRFPSCIPAYLQLAMWLLNACSWEMKEFISHKQAPPYAVLSHTWGEEEVSFRDWQHEPWEDVQRREGFGKIKNCCEQAAAEGLGWVWIDTCCIDKRSSAELTEAINSMFKWYESAAICYAYLCDVSVDIESNIVGCRWITRGWTLQELIAPREVVFYSCNWQSLGTRSNLSARLAIATGIHEPFLVGRNLNEASVAQRMSWAAKRSTSREEDEAYCLLGIFNINMPLIYGEGLKAFIRLQEILVREYPKDHSLFAWGKVVERLSNEVVDQDQAWGLKPLNIQHNPDEAETELFGLLAKRPRDFQHSGQLVFFDIFVEIEWRKRQESIICPPLP